MLAPPPGELTPPPRGNPGSATEYDKFMMINMYSCTCAAGTGSSQDALLPWPFQIFTNNLPKDFYVASATLFAFHFTVLL